MKWETFYRCLVCGKVFKGGRRAVIIHFVYKHWDVLKSDGLIDYIYDSLLKNGHIGIKEIVDSSRDSENYRENQESKGNSSRLGHTEQQQSDNSSLVFRID